jgi:hypothetical protein
MDGTGAHHVKPGWERQIPHVLSHMWNLDLTHTHTQHTCKCGTTWRDN